ncbi:MAG: hypothetical protein R6U52_00755 [Kosmotogaceae bacterium]
MKSLKLVVLMAFLSLFLTFSCVISDIPLSVELVSPANESVFNHYPRSMTLEWTAKGITGSVKYYLEIQFCWIHSTDPDNPNYFGVWEEGNYTGTVLEKTVNYYNFNFIGAQPGRWRVRAEDGNGFCEWTEWWYFKFTV